MIVSLSTNFGSTLLILSLEEKKNEGKKTVEPWLEFESVPVIQLWKTLEFISSSYAYGCMLLLSALLLLLLSNQRFHGSEANWISVFFLFAVFSPLCLIIPEIDSIITFQEQCSEIRHAHHYPYRWRQWQLWRYLSIDCCSIIGLWMKI